MRELIKYLKDKRFLIPMGFLIVFELIMQSGLYKNLLEPRSYAENVNRIRKVASTSPVNPQILILGTSVAYQGINLPLLNEKLQAAIGWQAQSGASEGAMLITQNLIYKDLKKDYPDLKLIVHVNEATFPWTARYSMDPSNRSMVAQFPRSQALKLLKEYRYNLSRDDYAYFYIKTLTYQKDLRNFALKPLQRIKKLGREFKKDQETTPLYPYINEYKYSIAAYPAQDLKECSDKAHAGIPEFNAQGVQVTDRHHRKAVWMTCDLARWDPILHPGAHQWKNLYFHRLGIFYNEIRKDGLKVVTVFPPYSDLIKDQNNEERMKEWRTHLSEIHGDDSYLFLDLRNTIHGKDNASYYYDTIHLNRKGSLVFTEILANRIISMKEKLQR